MASLYQQFSLDRSEWRGLVSLKWVVVVLPRAASTEGAGGRVAFAILLFAWVHFISPSVSLQFEAGFLLSPCSTLQGLAFLKTG